MNIPPSARGCNCQGNCTNPRICSCAQLNGGDFPYVQKDGGRYCLNYNIRFLICLVCLFQLYCCFTCLSFASPWFCIKWTFWWNKYYLASFSDWLKQRLLCLSVVHNVAVDQVVWIALLSRDWSIDLRSYNYKFTTKVSREFLFFKTKVVLINLLFHWPGISNTWQRLGCEVLGLYSFWCTSMWIHLSS